MVHRSLAAGVLATTVAYVAATAVGFAQSASPTTPPAAGGKAGTVPRTPDGRPDLGGVWSYATITPLERPADLGDKAVLTEEEAAAYEKQLLLAGNKDARAANRDQDVASAYNDFWWDRGTNIVGTRRTSLIVDPPNGRIPALTSEGAQRAGARAEARKKRGPADGPEDRNLAERCLVSLNAGPPIVPSAYNNHIQVFQTPERIAIFNEMIHNFRVVPLDGRPPLNPGVKQWMGDSRGQWQGDTLVIETTNFRAESAYRGASESLKVTERFTRVGPETLMYEFTMTDPRTWVSSWSGQLPMTLIEDKLYEYACHEGNQAMFNMLSGARAEEKAKQGTPPPR
jgi:hypothetical protein